MAIVVAASAIAFALGLACSDGTTPDCSLPDAGCGPVGEGGIPDTSPLAPDADAGDAGDAGDAPSDSDADAPRDVQGDG
jgi:hypothetical protein